MKKYSCYLIDLDGTIYRGKETIESGVEFVHRLDEMKIPYLFLTNNTTRTPEMVVAKLQDHGVKTDVSHIYTPVMATASYLKDKHPGNTSIRIYVIGQIGVKKGLFSDPRFVLDDQNPEYVIVGMDTDLTYHKIRTACRCIRNGATFIATNADKVLPANGELLPGNGSQCAMIATASDQEPLFIGKPAKPIIDYALKKINKTKAETLIVGDYYQTDICAGINSHIDTLLTLTGVTKKADLQFIDVQPTYVVNNLNEWQL